MKIAFTGHRDKVADIEDLRRLSRIYPGAVWCHGGAVGFDTQVDRFAIENGINVERILPDYDILGGKCAPLARNWRIVRGADLLVALYDGRKRGGTLYTIGLARDMGVSIKVIRPS